MRAEGRMRPLLYGLKHATLSPHCGNLRSATAYNTAVGHCVYPRLMRFLCCYMWSYT